MVIPAIAGDGVLQGLLHDLLTSISLGDYCCPTIVCWDNAPRPVIRSFEQEFPFIESIAYFGETNLNFAKNSNRGLRFVHEQLHLGAFLVNMDVCLPHRIYLERIINCGISSPSQRHIDGAVATKIATMNELCRQICISGRATMKEKRRLSGFCLWISEDALDRIGYLDDVTFIASFEDDDYCVRACLAGLPCTSYDIPVHHELKDRQAQLSTSNSYDFEQLLNHCHRFRRKWGVPHDVEPDEFASYILGHHIWDETWRVPTISAQ